MAFRIYLQIWPSPCQDHIKQIFHYCETDRKTVQDPHTLPSSNPKWEWNIHRLLAGSLKQLKSLIIGYNIGY